MKTFLKFLSYAIFLNIFVLACNSPKSDFTKEFAQKHTDKMIQDYINGDVNGIVDAYSEDAKMLEDGMPIVDGKEKILESTKALLGNIKFIKGSSEVIEVFSENNLAYDMSYFNLTALTKKDSVVIENKWKHISIWKRQINGEWKISRIIFNNR
jgi:ketosteroid isomerase-like protein